MIDTHAHLHLIDRKVEDIVFDANLAGVNHIIHTSHLYYYYTYHNV